MNLTLNQKATQEQEGWWSWEVWLDGPDADLDQIDSVEYLLHPTFSNSRPRSSDRASRFALRSSGWGEFMIYAQARPRSGEPVQLRHWLRLQLPVPGPGRSLLLVGSKEDETFTDELHSQLEKSELDVHRLVDPANLAEATVAVAVLSAGEHPWLPEDLESIRNAHVPLLAIALGDVEIPPCLASYRCPPDERSRLPAAVKWLVQVLDRSEVPFTDTASFSVPGAFWSRRLALASVDLGCAAAAVVPLIRGGRLGTAVAIAPDVVIAPADESMEPTCRVRLPQGEVPVVPLGPGKELVAFRLPSPTACFIPLSASSPLDPTIAIIKGGGEGEVPTLTPGWLTSKAGYDLHHDVAQAPAGAAIVSLENGSLLGLQTRPGRAVGAAAIRDLLPPGTLADRPQAGVLESADFLERRGSAEDYADRNGYDPEFLGIGVPLPRTKAGVELLKYRNFSVAVHRKRQLSLYAVVNIDGKRAVEEHRSGDPWQLDPRLPDDQQTGKSYYTGTPLDRGHMVRRIDPVWGKDFKQAELDTFHYTNSCPQHKNLNRKTWNDLEDYIYVHLKDDRQKVTVFTGPVLGNDDPLFHGKRLPQEFWKVVVIRRPDGKLSATAYLLSQEDMIKGLEFVFGEFRTYQVSIALIEKKTGLDFGNLRKHDPKAKGGALESAALPTEVRGAGDLDLGDLGGEPQDFLSAAANPVMRGVPPGLRPGPASVWAIPSTGDARLKSALQTFDWKTVEELAASLVVQLGQDPSQFDEPFARRILTGLQRKRRFSTMTRVGDAFIQAGLAGPNIQRRYAQALIEQGLFQAASLVLAGILSDPKAPLLEQEEAQGLLGRVSKQIYVNARAPENPKNVAQLEKAVNSYWLSYAVNRTDNFWHGINVVACLKRAARDKVSLRSDADDASKVAEEILKDMLRREEESRTGELQAFELATKLEALLALEQLDEAKRCAEIYVLAKDADAFEIGSTLRQLEEVWQLTDDSEPGSSLLPILRAAHLQQIGGALRLTAGSVRKELQKVFGADRSQSLHWYQQGLFRAASVARIEVNGKGLGTAWLVDAGCLAGKDQPRLLMVTNAHVMGPDTPNRYPDAVRTGDVKVHFQLQEAMANATKIVFHSPVNELDATLFEVARLPEGIKPLELDPSVMKLDDPPQRLYMIGHPGGRDLEFSLQDNHLLAANDRWVHYRTPSEGGSSGSPVFGPVDWKVVALHHAGSRETSRLDGTGSYEANEGIALAALRSHLAKEL